MTNSDDGSLLGAVLGGVGLSALAYLLTHDKCGNCGIYNHQSNDRCKNCGAYL